MPIIETNNPLRFLSEDSNFWVERIAQYARANVDEDLPTKQSGIQGAVSALKALHYQNTQADSTTDVVPKRVAPPPAKTDVSGTDGIENYESIRQHFNEKELSLRQEALVTDRILDSLFTSPEQSLPTFTLALEPAQDETYFELKNSSGNNQQITFLCRSSDTDAHKLSLNPSKAELKENATLKVRISCDRTQPLATNYTVDILDQGLLVGRIWVDVG